MARRRSGTSLAGPEALDVAPSANVGSTLDSNHGRLCLLVPDLEAAFAVASGSLCLTPRSTYGLAGLCVVSHL
jgi:hypothetical protein